MAFAASVDRGQLYACQVGTRKWKNDFLSDEHNVLALLHRSCTIMKLLPSDGTYES